MKNIVITLIVLIAVILTIYIIYVIQAPTIMGPNPELSEESKIVMAQNLCKNECSRSCILNTSLTEIPWEDLGSVNAYETAYACADVMEDACVCQ